MKITQDENKAVIQVMGITSNVNHLMELFCEKINELGLELGLRTGEKINLRKIGLLLD